MVSGKTIGHKNDFVWNFQDTQSTHFSGLSSISFWHLLLDSNFLKKICYLEKNFKISLCPQANLKEKVLIKNYGNAVVAYLTSPRWQLTPTLSAWPLRGHTVLKSILWETVFLDQMHYFSLLPLNTFLQLFLKLKYMKKFLHTKKISFSNPDFHKPTRFYSIFIKC